MAGRWQRRRETVAIQTSECIVIAGQSDTALQSSDVSRSDLGGSQDTKQIGELFGGLHRDPKSGELFEGPGIASWPIRFDGSEGRHADPWGPGQLQRTSWKRPVRQGQGIEEALSVIGAEAGSRQEKPRGDGYCPAGEADYKMHAEGMASSDGLSDLPLSDLHSLHAEKLDHLKSILPAPQQQLPHAGINVQTKAMQRNIRRARQRAEQRGELVSADSGKTGGCVVLVRDDCRLHDNPALFHALTSHVWVMPLYVHDDSDPSPLPVCGAGLYWRHMSLASYHGAIFRCNGRLVIRKGGYIEEILDVLLASGARSLYFNRQLEPWYHERDLEIERKLAGMGFEVKSFKGMVLHREPWEQMEPRPPPHLLTKYQGDPTKETEYQGDPSRSSAQRTPHDLEPPLPTVKDLGGTAELVDSLTLSALGYGLSAGKGMPMTMLQYNSMREMKIKEGSVQRDSQNDWAFEMRKFWSFGEAGGLAQLERFLVEAAAGHYQPPERYRADKPWTALLSPYLRFGDLSPRYVYMRAREVLTFIHWKPLLRRLFWRDGAYAQLYRWPLSYCQSIRKEYESEKWNGTPDMLRRWQRGETGFPLIDAAMRQLWKVGWMPNYLRHVTAQFLMEYLDISWKAGFQWFDYTLVDSDVAINSMMWQMGGHSGLGSWNFVMHPVFAGKKVDPEGLYVRKWLPELRNLPVEYIHCPWEAPCACLLSANVLIPKSYPEQVIQDLVKARRSHAQNVIAVRRAFPEMVREDGHEILDVDGEKITVRVRDDLKDNSLDISLLMTPDEAHSMQRRRLTYKGIHHDLLFEDSKKYEAIHDAGGTL